MSERRRKRALITRPQEDSADAAIALARRGITPVLAPMMRIEYAEADIESEVTLAQAVLFTSRNGVRAFSRLSQRRDVTVLAVGDSTASLARDSGFVNVESADGDSADLARLTIDRLDPANGLLFHAAGAAVAGDLTESLNKAGFKTVRRTVYEAKALDALADDTATALRDRTLDYVLFFSPRTGRIFIELVKKAGLEKTCDSLTAICLSEAVALEIADLEWRDTVIARLPTTTALLAVIAGLEDSSTPPPAQTLPAEDPDAMPDPAPPATPAIENTAGDERQDSGAPASVDNGETNAPDEETASVDRNTAADEDETEPQGNAMTEPVPSRRASVPPSQKPAASEDTPSKPETPETQDAGETAEMRESAAALSATLAATPAAVEPPRRSRAGTVLVTLLAVIVVLGAGYATLPSWRDRLPQQVRDHLAGSAGVSAALQEENRRLVARIAEITAGLQAKEAELAAAQNRIGAMDNRATDLQVRIADGEKALADLRKTNAEGAAVGAENASLKARIAELNQSFAAEKEARAAAEAATKKAEALASARADAAGKLAATIDQATGKIANLEKRLDAARKAAVLAGKTDTIALAARRLRDALDRAAPFTQEISALKDMVGDTPAVTAAIGEIEPMAATGVATRSDLFARLPAVVDAAVTAYRQPANDSWVDKAVAKLTGFVTVRRVDGKGTDADAALARAEIAAQRGDLAAAVTEMSSLTGAGAQAKPVTDWLKTARARLAADKARTALDKIVLSGVTAGDPS